MVSARAKSCFPLHRRLQRFDTDLSFMARRELRSFGAIVLYQRSGERRHLLEIDWHRVTDRRRWDDIADIVDAIRSEEVTPSADNLDIRSRIDLTAHDTAVQRDHAGCLTDDSDAEVKHREV